MTTRDETVWDRDARAALAALLSAHDGDGVWTGTIPQVVTESVKYADALAAERAKRGGAGEERGASRVDNEQSVRAIRVDRDWWKEKATDALKSLDDIREAVGAPYGETTYDAARRVVRERDAAREVAATLTAERDEAKEQAGRFAVRLNDAGSALGAMHCPGDLAGSIKRVVMDRDDWEDQAKRLVKERDAALSRAEQAERALGERPGAELVEAAAKLRARNAEFGFTFSDPEWLDRALKSGRITLTDESRIALCGLVRAACSTPAPAPFDAAGLKVGDRVRLKDGTVKEIDRGVVMLQIDGERDPYGKASETAVWPTAIAAKVSP